MSEHKNLGFIGAKFYSFRECEFYLFARQTNVCPSANNVEIGFLFFCVCLWCLAVVDLGSWRFFLFLLCVFLFLLRKRTSEHLFYTFFVLFLGCLLGFLFFQLLLPTYSALSCLTFFLLCTSRTNLDSKHTLPRDEVCQYISACLLLRAPTLTASNRKLQRHTTRQSMHPWFALFALPQLFDTEESLSA
jgi:hypothetical protein